MKTKLVFPGFWTCSAPYLSLPSLTAFLRMHGKDVEQIDLNLEFTDRILSKDFLDYCLHKYEDIVEIDDQQVVPYLDAIGKYVCENIEEQKNIMRSNEALDILVYEKCCYFIAMASVLHDLVNRFYVSAPDKSSGQRVQDVHISLACIGFLPESIIAEMLTHAAKSRTA